MRISVALSAAHSNVPRARSSSADGGGGDVDQVRIVSSPFQGPAGELTPVLPDAAERVAAQLGSGV